MMLDASIWKASWRLSRHSDYIDSLSPSLSPCLSPHYLLSLHVMSLTRMYLVLCTEHTCAHRGVQTKCWNSEKRIKWNAQNNKSIHSSPVRSSLWIRVGDYYLFNAEHRVPRIVPYRWRHAEPQPKLSLQRVAFPTVWLLLIVHVSWCLKELLCSFEKFEKLDRLTVLGVSLRNQAKSSLPH